MGNQARRTDEGKAIRLERVPKRIRAIFDGRTIADTLDGRLLLEPGHPPVYYFPRADVWRDALQPSETRSHCPERGVATHWSLVSGGRQARDAAWAYEDPPEQYSELIELCAFDWIAVDHWFEEDEEVFGHARDPHHRIDVRPSSREVRILFAGETICQSRRCMFLFETGLPARYYIPPEDVRMDLLRASRRTSTCPYKGHAIYWSIHVGERASEDAVWSYPEPLPECPRIKGHLAFYPEKVDTLDVEGGTT